MSNSKFYSPIYMDLSPSTNAQINLFHNDFTITNHDVSYLSSIKGNESTHMYIRNNRFSSNHADSAMFSFTNSYNSLLVDSCYFGIDLNLNNLNVITNFTITNSHFSKISMKDAVLPPSGGVAVDWRQLKNTLCILGTHSGPSLDNIKYWSEQKDSIYLSKTDGELANYVKYEMLVASYYNLLRIYKDRGDLKSANACYIEVKDLQTKMLGYEHRTNPTVSNFFVWIINQFLRYFCDYGTNPAKSVILSFYVILLFGGFYFFFYSAWDRINKSYFLSRYLALSKYLSSKTTLGELYQNTKTREISSYSEFKKELQLKKKEVPLYVTFLGHILYRFSTSRFDLSLWIIKRLDLHKDLWSELKSGKKVLVGTIIGLSILIFGVYTILIKSLSATMLSLNAFSTLGFGNIPVKGLSKYLTVIEGFLGWLLLSIFSVSLIAQMIQ